MRAALLAALALAGAVAGCGGDGDDAPPDADRGAGVGAFGAGARVETLARTRLPARPPGELAWVADETRLEPGERIEHRHELAFAYARRGSHHLDGSAVAEGAGTAVAAGDVHTHSGSDRPAVFWEVRLVAPDSPPRPGARRVFESEPLEGIPAPAAVSFLKVTVPPRGGRTSVHTHPGPELVYELSGRIEYQNAIIGSKELGPGGLEGIPPGTAVQKRNPFAEPGVFLSWFLVDPDRPFAPRASF